MLTLTRCFVKYEICIFYKNSTINHLWISDACKKITVQFSLKMRCFHSPLCKGTFTFSRVREHKKKALRCASGDGRESSLRVPESNRLYAVYSCSYLPAFTKVAPLSQLRRHLSLREKRQSLPESLRFLPSLINKGGLLCLLFYCVNFTRKMQ